MTHVIVPAITDTQILEALGIRLEVFVAEQGVPLVLEIDARDQDPEVLHLLARERGGPALGTCRIIPDGDGRWHLGRIAVAERARGRALGAALVAAAHERIARSTPTGRTAEVRLDAQVRARGFYLKQGYRDTGAPIFEDAGIPHIEMARTLTGLGTSGESEPVRA